MKAQEESSQEVRGIKGNEEQNWEISKTFKALIAMLITHTCYSNEFKYIVHYNIIIK